MFNYLRHAVEDVLSRRNLELHFASLGIPVSLFLAGLSIAHIDYSKYASAIIIWFIGLLAASILVDRWNRDEFQARLSKTAWKDNEDDFKNRIGRATEVSILAVSPHYFLRQYKSELERILALRDGKVRFLFIGKDEKAMELIKLGREENIEHSRLFIEEAKQLRPDPSGGAKSSLMVKSLNYVPSCIITMIDDGKTDGAIFATTYSFNQIENRPSLMLTRGERAWYAFYQQEFENLWDSKAAHDAKL
jgi:hypothetical protein